MVVFRTVLLVAWVIWCVASAAAMTRTNRHTVKHRTIWWLCGYLECLHGTWTWTRITGQWHFVVVSSFLTYFLFFVMCTTVWVKKIPLRFSGFFPNGWEFFYQFLYTHYTFLCILDYNFLFNYFQLWRSYAILSATTKHIFYISLER